MIPIPPGVRVWIATGHTDMRRGMNSLALLVQEAFKRDPHGGDLYVFRGKSVIRRAISYDQFQALGSCGIGLRAAPMRGIVGITDDLGRRSGRRRNCDG